MGSQVADAALGGDAMNGMMSPVTRLARKSTQDLIDRLRWLEDRAVKADGRIGSWMSRRATIEEQIADVRLALRQHGVVDVPK